MEKTDNNPTNAQTQKRKFLCPCGGQMVFRNSMLRDVFNPEIEKYMQQTCDIFVCPQCNSKTLLPR